MARAFCCIFLLTSTLFSQVKKDSITSLDEVTLIEQYTKKNAKGLVESSRLKTEDLAQFSPIDFSNGINQISGVYLLSGALNTNRITIRGVGARTPFGTDKLRLYFNGIPVTDGTGTSTIEAFDFENLGQIEVIKGPKATTLGANLGGAIVLNSKSPEAGNTFLNNSFTLGSFDLLKNNLAFRHSEKKFNINLNYNHLETEGFRQNNFFERDGFLLTSSIRIYEKGKLDFVLNHIDYTAGIPSTINATDFEENPTRAAANWLAAQGFETNNYTLAGLSHQHRFNENLKTVNSIFYSYNDHFEPRPFNILDEFTNGFGLRSITEGTLLKGEFSIGGEFYRDEYNWQTFANLFRENNGQGSLQGGQLSYNKEFRSQLNLFTTYTFPIAKQLQAQVGLNFNKTSFEFRDFFLGDGEDSSAERQFDPFLMPNFGVTYHLKTGRIFANISRGFSNPGLEETLNPDGVLNPEIDQEKGTNFELGTVLSLFKNRLAIASSLYQININDLLVAERISEDQFIGRNAGETRHRGLELDLSYSGRLSTQWQIQPRVSYSYSNHSFIDFVDGDDDFSGNNLAGVPRHRLNSGLTISKNNSLIFNLTHQFVDEIPLTDGNDLFSESFSILNAKVQFQTDITSNLQLGLHAGINNIFDTNYAQSVLVNAVGFGNAQPRFFWPGNGINYYSSLQLRYQLRQKGAQ